MHVLLNVLVAVQMIAALSMIGLVLVQHGKGADMGASFGSGSSGSLFGASGSANFLSRMTAVCAAVFFVCTLGLAYFSNFRGGAPEAGSSVLERPSAPAGAGASAAPAPMVPPTGAAQIPGKAAPTAEPAAPSSPAPSAAPSVSSEASGAAAIPTK
jgi:preprotein translocase subunit SecG